MRNRLRILPLATCAATHAGEFPRELNAWDDATQFTGVSDCIPQFSKTTDPEDLSMRGYDVTDDVLYGIDTPRWLPDENPQAHELTREAFPWFGDEMELLINASNRWPATEDAAGNGSSWQMVCNVSGAQQAAARVKPGGRGNLGNFHHEDWFAGAKDTRTQLRQWGTLWIRNRRR